MAAVPFSTIVKPSRAFVCPCGHAFPTRVLHRYVGSGLALAMQRGVDPIIFPCPECQKDFRDAFTGASGFDHITHRFNITPGTPRCPRCDVPFTEEGTKRARILSPKESRYENCPHSICTKCAMQCKRDIPVIGFGCDYCEVDLGDWLDEQELRYPLNYEKHVVEGEMECAICQETRTSGTYWECGVCHIRACSPCIEKWGNPRCIQCKEAFDSDADDDSELEETEWDEG